MLRVGSSKPWPEVLEEMSGSRKLQANALLEFFQPLNDWLENEITQENITVGWKSTVDDYFPSLKKEKWGWEKKKIKPHAHIFGGAALNFDIHLMHPIFSYFSARRAWKVGRRHRKALLVEREKDDLGGSQNKGGNKSLSKSFLSFPFFTRLF